MPRTAAVSFRSAALATLERSDRDASPRFSNRDPPRPPDQPPHRPTNPVPRSTTTFRGVSRSLISAVVDDDVPWSVALGFCSAAFCRGAWVRVSSFDRAIYPGRRVLPRSTLSRSSFYGGVYPGRRRARPSALRLGPHGLPALQTQRQVPPSPPFCRGRWVCGFAAEPAFAKCRATRQQQPTAPPRVLLSSVVVSRKRPHRGERFSPSGENSRSRKCAGDEERSDDSEGSRADRRSSARAATPRSGRKAPRAGRARRRPRRFRGWLCAVSSQPQLKAIFRKRGQPSASHRNAGQTNG